MPHARTVAMIVHAMASTTHATPNAPPAIDDAIRAAAAVHKPLIVEFSTTWCGPCLVFDQEVLTGARVQRALRDVMFVDYDAEAAPGRRDAARFRVDSYPTFIVLDRCGAEMTRRRGLLDERLFLELMSVAKKGDAAACQGR